MHLLFRDKNSDPSKLMKEQKTYTSKQLSMAIGENPQESRKEWMMQRAGAKSSNVKSRQFLQQHNKLIELWSGNLIKQKLDYIHQSPVETGFVVKPERIEETCHKSGTCS